MTYPLKDRAFSADSPASDIMPVTPSDSAALTVAASALFVETGGVLQIVTLAGQDRSVTVQNNSLLPVITRQVKATGTTAQGIHALVHVPVAS